MFRTTGLAIATIRWISPTLGADDDGLASDPTALASHATPTVVYALSDATRRIWWNGAWRRCRPWLRIRRRALAGRALADVRARASPGGKRLVARCCESKWYWTGGSEARFRDGRFVRGRQASPGMPRLGAGVLSRGDRPRWRPPVRIPRDEEARHAAGEPHRP